MAEEPFAWEVHAQLQVLEDELAQLRDLPYSLWRDVIHAPYTKKADGRDGKSHRLKIEADWDRAGSVDIRVTATVKPTARGVDPVSGNFVITPDNTFRDAPEPDTSS